jgi:hypothetical protein
MLDGCGRFGQACGVDKLCGFAHEVYETGMHAFLLRVGNEFDCQDMPVVATPSQGPCCGRWRKRSARLHVGKQLRAMTPASAGAQETAPPNSNPHCAFASYCAPNFIDRNPMKLLRQPNFQFKTSLLSAFGVALLLALPAAEAATISKADYKAGKTRISEDYKAQKSACGTSTGNAKDICAEEAKAQEKVARAELEYAYSGKPKDQNKVLVAKAESAYAVAKEKCDDQTGNNKDVCVKAAKADEVKALADAKMGKEIKASQTDAAQSKRDAEYKLAAEKCEALAGDAKSNCMTAAKGRFGKS